MLNSAELVGVGITDSDYASTVHHIDPEDNVGGRSVALRDFILYF